MAQTTPGEGGAGQEPASERSLGELVSDANTELAELLRLQVELAKAEIAHDVKAVATGTGMFVAAAFVAHLVLILLSVTIGLVLAHFWFEPWAAFAIVTGFYLLIVIVLGLWGWGKFRSRHGTPETKATLPRTMSAIRRRKPEPAGDEVVDRR